MNFKTNVECFYANSYKFEQKENNMEQLRLNRLLCFLILLPVFLQYIIKMLKSQNIDFSSLRVKGVDGLWTL